MRVELQTLFHDWDSGGAGVLPTLFKAFRQGAGDPRKTFYFSAACPFLWINPLTDCDSDLSSSGFDLLFCPMTRPRATPWERNGKRDQGLKARSKRSIEAVSLLPLLCAKLTSRNQSGDKPPHFQPFLISPGGEPSV
jgi:hypothetical protein